MKNPAQIIFPVLLAILAVITGSLGTIFIMNAKDIHVGGSKLTTATPTTPVVANTTPPVASPVSSSIERKIIGAGYVHGIGTVRYGEERTTLDDYRSILEESLSNYWFDAYASLRPGNASIYDLKVGLSTYQIDQISIPSILITWPTVSFTPWRHDSFSATFSKAQRRVFGASNESVQLRLVTGNAAALDEVSETDLGSFTCANSTEDITFIANFFALAYPDIADDKDLCAHVSTAAVPNDYYPNLKAYTLSAAFTPYDIEQLSGGEMIFYKPTVLMVAAKKEDMVKAFEAGHFSILETNLTTIGSHTALSLAPTADSLIALYKDIKVPEYCGYDSCY